VPFGVAELGQPQLVVRRPVHEVRLREELHGSRAQRCVRGRDVGHEIVDGGRGMVELWRFRDADQDGGRAALKERHLGRRLEKKRHAEGVAIKTDGAIEVLGPHEDLADRGEAELGRGSTHTAGSCWVRQCSVPSPHTKSTAWIPTTGRSLISSARMPSAMRSSGSLNVGTRTALFAM